MTEALTLAPGQDPTQRAIFTGGSAGLATSLPTATLEEKIAAAQLAADDTMKLDNLINEEIVISDVLIHPVEIVNKETGEVGTFPRTVMVTDRGPVAAVSTGVVKDLAKLAALFGGAGTWKAQGGIRVKVKQIQTGNSRRTYALIPLGLGAGEKSGKRRA